MKTTTGARPQAEMLRARRASCIRLNAATLCAAARSMGHTSMTITADARDGRCRIWSTATPDGELVVNAKGWPDVAIRKLTDDGATEDATMSFARALSTLMRETIELGRPSWRGIFAQQSFRLEIKDDVADLAWSQGFGNRKETGCARFEPQPWDVFVAKASIVDTKTGAWYEIETLAEAEAAGFMSGTGVAHFFSAKRDDPARWFVHVEMQGETACGGVTLAAQSTKGFDPSAWPHFSHVTGRNNADVYRQRETDIRALAKKVGLVIEPNWMGKPLSRDTAPATSEEESAGRILRAQIDQGWTTETLEMLSRRFIEACGLSTDFAEFLEEQARFENGSERPDL